MTLHSSNNASRAQAFTLTELLVVVAIIALLLAILLPSFERAREMARRVKCASNQHQIAVSLITLATDRCGQLPEAYRNKHDRAVHPHFFREDVWQFMRDTQGMVAPAMYCPSSWSNGQPRAVPGAGEDLQYVAENSTWPAGYISGYAYLYGMTNLPGSTDPRPAVLTSPERLYDAGDMHLVGEQHVSWQASSNAGRQRMSHPTTLGGTTLPEGGNRAWLDGHAEWVGRTELGRDDTPLEPTGSWKWGGVERYDHWTPGDRRYYW